ALKHVDALRADGGEQIVQVFRGMDAVRNQLIHLVVGETAFFFSRIDECLNVVKSQAEFLFSAVPHPWSTKLAAVSLNSPVRCADEYSAFWTSIAWEIGCNRYT